jgi:hypothetical protein
LSEFSAVEGYSATPGHPLGLMCLAAGLTGQRHDYGLGFAQSRASL